jgi:hypothetical protein
MKTMASSPHRMTTDNQGVHFLALLSRTLLMRGWQRKVLKANNVKDRKQAQRPRTASTPLRYRARQRRPLARAGAAGHHSARFICACLRSFAFICV